MRCMTCGGFLLFDLGDDRRQNTRRFGHGQRSPVGCSSNHPEDDESVESPHDAAAKMWPHRKKPVLGFERPRSLDIPTLLLSGALDPVTPPEYGEEAATYFPNSLRLTIEEGQHGPFDLAGPSVVSPM